MFFWKYYILFSFLSLYKKDDNRTLRKKSFEVCGFGNHPFVNSSSILFIWFSPFIYYVKKVYWNTYNQLFLRVVGIFLSQIFLNSIRFRTEILSRKFYFLIFSSIYSLFLKKKCKSIFSCLVNVENVL